MTADLPPGYPREFERRLRLRDGRDIGVRPIRPTDAPMLANAIRTADRDTLRRRFMGATPHVTPTLLDYLTRVDYHTRFALVALDPRTEEGIAIGRYELVSKGIAEVAIAVSPAWRRLGIATALVRLLAEAATQHGVHAFTALYLAENRPVAALASHSETNQLIKQGVTELTVALDVPAPADQRTP